MEPPTHKKVHFRIRKSSLSSWRLHSSLSVRSSDNSISLKSPLKPILRPFKPTENCVASTEVLHESLVRASHTYWVLQNEFHKMEGNDGGKTKVSAIELLSEPRYGLRHDFPFSCESSPMRYASNKEFLSDGCSTFSHLKKAPQIDFPTTAAMNTQISNSDSAEPKNTGITDEDRVSGSTTATSEKEVKVAKSKHIPLNKHAHLKLSYFPHLKNSRLNKRHAVTKRKVSLVMEAEELDEAQVRMYLLDTCKVSNVGRQDVEITAVEHSCTKTSCKIVFPSGKMARKFKTDINKIKHKTRCYAKMYDETEDVNVVKQRLQERMGSLVNDSDETLKVHKAKLNKIDKKMKKAQRKKKHLAELSNITEEREALKQKQQELKKQKEEYLSFMSIFQRKFMSIHKSTRWPMEAAAFEKRYQIEKERLQSTLPMYSKRTEIVKMISENQVSILLGETGSGKSTQVAQYLYEAGLAGQKKIVCTQPRKVAATSLAKRVSDEMLCHLGDTIGFKVGVQKQMSKETRILYVTDHTLLKECLDDPLLMKYSCVIIDEAHERSINTDLLLAMIKKALVHRSDLRVIITSATINPDVFVRFFCGCPVLRVSGRVFPVDVIYCAESIDPDINCVQRAVDKVIEVVLQKEPGDILVFLTTPLETEQACEMMMAKIRVWPSHKNKITCLALHGKIQSMDQQKVFNPTPVGKRKIVFATNSAETSVTIPGIKVVIDTGLAKEKMYDHAMNMSSLKVTKISQSSADQRKGRAGRTEKGKCYRLYREEDYESMDSSSKPEIMKVHLGMVLLTLLSLEVKDPLSFDFVEMPPHVGLEKAMKVLIYLEAVDKDGHLTPLGKKMAVMSLEPRMAKLILNGIDRGIGLECVLVASFNATGGNIFNRGGSESNKQLADKLKARFCNLRGDIHTMMDVYREWNTQPEKQKNKWCMENSINAKCMRMVRDSVKEIQATLSSDLRRKVQKLHKDTEYMETTLEAVMLESYAMNLCVFTGHESLGYMMVTDLDKHVHVHPSSALKLLATSPHYVIYENTLTTSRPFAINIVCISEDMLAKFCHQDSPAINFDKINERIVGERVISDIGPAIIKKVCGPKNSTLMTMQKDLQAYFCTEMLILETNVEAGTLSIHTLPSIQDECRKLVIKMIMKEQECLFQDDMEMLLEEGCSTRAIIGHGGQTEYLLFANEFRALHIRKIPRKYSTEDLIEEFQELAVVANYEGYKMLDNKRGLKVVFKHPEAAKEVLKDTSILPGVIAMPDLTGDNKSRVSPGETSKVKVTWCRRRNRGVAYINFHANSPFSAKNVISKISQVTVDGNRCPVKFVKDNDEALFVDFIPATLASHQASSEIKDSIEAHLGELHADVTVPNEPPFKTSREDCNLYKWRIEAWIQAKAPDVSDFKVSITIPRDEAVQYVALVSVQDGLEADLIHKALTEMEIFGRTVEVHMMLKSFIMVQEKIYHHLKDELECMIGKLKHEMDGLSFQGKWLEREEDGFRIDISAQSAADLTWARTQIATFLGGKRIDILNIQHLQYFKNTQKGQEFIQSVKQTYHIHVIINQYQSVFILYGAQDQTLKATQEIMKKINELMHAHIKTHALKEFYPAGMTKRLMEQYGFNLQGLADASGAEMVDLQLRHHVLTAHGTEGAIATVEKLLDLQASALTTKKRGKDQQSLPECPVCLCEVESHYMYRLEYCGHAYCKSCIKGLMEHGAKDKSFPIQCAKDGCNKDIVVKDIFALVGTSMDQLSPFIKASIDGYVLSHGNELKYCIKPDCNMVYRVNEGNFGVCGQCHTKICTLCNSEYHPSMNCELNKKIKNKIHEGSFDEYSKETWLEDDRKNRALCPKCNNGIEKNGGCMHVCCAQCKAHICWKCKETFQTQENIYDHLVECNGAIFNLEDL